MLRIRDLAAAAHGDVEEKDRRGRYSVRTGLPTTDISGRAQLAAALRSLTSGYSGSEAVSEGDVQQQVRSTRELAFGGGSACQARDLCIFNGEKLLEQTTSTAIALLHFLAPTTNASISI